MRVREARPEEATPLADLQERASVEAFAHVFPPERHPFPRAAVRTRWVEALEDPVASIVVAEVDGEAVGVALVRPEWLEGLYVAPEWWGKGIADQLHNRALEIVKGAGAERCHLWVLQENPRARRFYERRGWVENGETRVVEFPPNPLDVGYALDL